jgi:DeoR family transcriptional regulator, aga operon transcriptional repressor
MLTMIRARDFTRVTDLSSTFGISEVTVRSDLDHLERRGNVRRVHGGAIPDARPPRRERPFEEVASTGTEEKQAIGRRAAALVSSGDTVIMDVGTTTTAVSRALMARQELTDVVVVTNGLNIALEFEAAMPRFDVIVTGGTVRPLQHSLVSPFAGLVLEQLNADILFLGCNGIHTEAGVTNVNLPEAEMKHQMMKAARRTIAVADSSKVGEISVARICTLDEVDRLITGTAASAELLEQLESAGLEIEVV